MSDRTAEFGLGIGGILPYPIVAVGLLLAGMGFVAVSQLQTSAVVKDAMLNLSLALAVIAGVGWFVGRWCRLAARWATVVALIAAVHSYASTIELPAALTLVAVPIGLAIPLISLPAAVLAGVSETLLLAIWPRQTAPGVDTGTLSTCLIVVWSVIGAGAAFLRYTRERTTWLADRYSQLYDAIADKRAGEEKLLETARALAHANRQLLLANERTERLRAIAEDAERTKSAFVARVSHEFRTPLNMIIGLSELMADAARTYAVVLPPDMQQDVETVLRNCRHLSDLIGDVLDLTRVQAGRMPLYKERVDLAAIVRAAVGAVRPLIDKKGLEVEIDVPEQLPEVYCDRARIRQVVLNLVSNAARYTDAGSIRIGASTRNGTVLTRVSDTGRGIAPEDLERVFEPFRQSSDEGVHGGVGSGLGLSISQQFVRLHGGRMWVESERGAGSTFYFELPVTPPMEHTAAPGRWIRDDWVWRESMFHTESAVSIAGDRRPLLAVWDKSGGLSSELSGFGEELEALTIGDLNQLVDAAQANALDLVMVNCADPHELVSMIGQVAATIRGIPVVGSIITERTGRAQAVGASGYLVKPITRADLVQALQNTGRIVERVLVVDDDPDVRGLLPRLLRLHDPLMRTDTAVNGEEALERLRCGSYDLVLLDVLLPDMDGWEVLQRTRDEGLHAEDVVFVSGQDPDDHLAVSAMLMATLDGGVPVERLLQCSVSLSKLLPGRPGRHRTAH